ncbi:MAG: TonB-dependent receptor plug domain-containing protein [Pseudobdellovibrio sp.]
MKRNLIFKLFILLGVYGSISYAQQEIELTVADTSFTSSQKVVITREDIQKAQVKNIAELLSTQANVSITTSSVQPNSIFIRGGDSGHVLFLIDGVPFYDASSIQRTVDISTINMQAIKRIEVIKGSQSVTYGGQALSAVIKIETLPTEHQNLFRGSLSGGKRYTSLELSGQKKLSNTQSFGISVKLSDQAVESPVKSSAKTYPQKSSAFDVYWLKNFGSQSEWKVVVKSEYSEDKREISSVDFMTSLPVDTDNYNVGYRSTHHMAKISRDNLFDLTFSEKKSKRFYEQASQYDTVFFTGTNENYQGSLQSVRLDMYALNTDRVSVDSGVSFNREELYYLNQNTVMADHFNEYAGLFLRLKLKLSEDLRLESGYRKEFQKGKAFSDTYHIGAVVNENIRLEHSTGFKAPSLYQLYSQIGNTSLNAEKVTTTSLSYDQITNADFNQSVALFKTQYKDLIDTRGVFPNSKYYNVTRAESQGVEYSLYYQLPDQNLNFKLTVGYQEPKNSDSNTWLMRRALSTGSLLVNYQIDDKLYVGSEMLHVGSRREGYFSGAGVEYTTLKSYTLLNLVTQYKINKNFELFARAENVASASYEVSYRYYGPKFVLRSGLNFVY